ncbi:hypothetical protein GCM10010389_21620 [Streptomyces echinoruber]|uniref:Uncharacterized protein n=1 Tax=Streptomyces echinoruber TaxID=68898 RepID=A0A918R3A4_9ACTN|nr:hypothetical protein GCM10010389_21620 [Streptomyces echinoruber]
MLGEHVRVQVEDLHLVGRVVFEGVPVGSVSAVGRRVRGGVGHALTLSGPGTRGPAGFGTRKTMTGGVARDANGVHRDGRFIPSAS